MSKYNDLNVVVLLVMFFIMGGTLGWLGGAAITRVHCERLLQELHNEKR